jgi:adenylosuccinate lyase
LNDDTNAYSRPEIETSNGLMKTNVNKWLDVEIARLDAWAELGVVPRKAMPENKACPL